MKQQEIKEVALAWRKKVYEACIEKGIDEHLADYTANVAESAWIEGACWMELELTNTDYN